MMNMSKYILKVLVTTLRSLLFVTLLVFEVLPVRENTVTIKSSSEIRFRLVKFDMARRAMLSCHCLQLFQGVLHLFCHTPQRICATELYSCNVYLL